MTTPSLSLGQIWTWAFDYDIQPETRYYVLINDIDNNYIIGSLLRIRGTLETTDDITVTPTQYVRISKLFGTMPQPTLVTDQKIITQTKMLLL